jgi:Cu2+-exporting ATPase
VRTNRRSPNANDHTAAAAEGTQHGEHHFDRYAHAGHHAEEFRHLFWRNLVLAIPVLVFSELFSDLLGYTLPSGTAWISPVFGIVLFLYGGRVFLTGGYHELRAQQPGMMTLIGFAITVAFVASLATSLGIGNLDLDFWWELALLIVIMLLGHWQEMRAVGQAQGALAALAELLPDEADRVTAGGRVETIPLSQLRVGDIVLVRPGGRVPADGEVIDGEADFDESTITGESRPVPRAVGDRVVAGTIATDSAVRVRIDAVGGDTALAGIQRLVDEAQQSRSRAQALADRAAAFLFYVAVTAGIVTFTVWMLLGNSSTAVENTVTVLVISCPHALGLAIPLVVALSTAISAKAGILVKDRLALERMREIDAVLFDKTGTLTKGAHVVTGVAPARSRGGAKTPDDVLALAAAVESDSEHPLAKAIVTAAQRAGRQVPAARDFRSITGRGVEATVDGVPAAVGGPALLRERNLREPDELARNVEEWKQRGAAVLYVVQNGEVRGGLALEDEIRPESKQAVDDLHALGVKVVMITGDAKAVADAVAKQLGIDEVFAEVLPEDKDKAVAELQGRGLRVAMVGDGVNDAPALARADVGIAIGAGTDVAIESAGVILASSDPRGVIGVIELSRRSYVKMIQNLAWATGYNVVAIPLAAGVFAWAGFTLPPAAGAVAMSLSTLIVAINAQTLRHRLDLRPEQIEATLTPRANATAKAVSHA